MEPAKPPQKLLDRMRDILRTQHYSLRTEQAYVEWVRRFILFHQKRHSKDMGVPEVEAFLTYLALERHVAASTQNQALSALLFLYREVLRQPLESVDAVRARRPERLPTVLTRSEVARVLSAMSGSTQLMAKLLYGSGLRALECLRLRVKDLDFEQRCIIVRDGKGEKDRVTMLPDSYRVSLTPRGRFAVANRQPQRGALQLPVTNYQLPTPCYHLPAARFLAPRAARSLPRLPCSPDDLPCARLPGTRARRAGAAFASAP